MGNPQVFEWFLCLGGVEFELCWVRGGPVSVKSFQGNTHVLVKEFKGKESAFVIQWHGKIIFTS